MSGQCRSCFDLRRQFGELQGEIRGAVALISGDHSHMVVNGAKSRLIRLKKERADIQERLAECENCEGEDIR